jgi:hypothetical protein
MARALWLWTKLKQKLNSLSEFPLTGIWRRSGLNGLRQNKRGGCAGLATAHQHLQTAVQMEPTTAKVLHNLN